MHLMFKIEAFSLVTGPVSRWLSHRHDSQVIHTDANSVIRLWADNKEPPPPPECSGDQEGSAVFHPSLLVWDLASRNLFLSTPFLSVCISAEEGLGGTEWPLSLIRIKTEATHERRAPIRVFTFASHERDSASLQELVIQCDVRMSVKACLCSRRRNSFYKCFFSFLLSGANTEPRCIAVILYVISSRKMGPTNNPDNSFFLAYIDTLIRRESIGK